MLHKGFGIIDHLERASASSDELRNGTLVQSFATLIAKLIAIGDQKGRESEVRRFLRTLRKSYLGK